MGLLEDIAANLKIFDKAWASVTDFLKMGINLDSVLDDVLEKFTDIVTLDDITGSLPGLSDIGDKLEEIATTLGLPSLSDIENIDWGSLFDWETLVQNPVVVKIIEYIGDIIEGAKTWLATKFMNLSIGTNRGT